MSHPAYHELARNAQVLVDTHRILFGHNGNNDSAAVDTERGSHVLQAMEMLRSLLEMHPQAAAIADLQATWVVANSAFGRLFGVSTSLQNLAEIWRDHFAMQLSPHATNLWSALSMERQRLDAWFVKRKHDGTRSRFLAHGRLLEHKPDGNSLIAWTFFEAGPCPDMADLRLPGDLCLKEEAEVAQVNRRTRGRKASFTKEALKLDCKDCVDKSREALRLLLLHTNEQKKDMEKRIAENYLLTVAPLIDHLKSMNLPPSQAYLLETLEFNLKHINSVFRIKVRSATKRLSDREIEICQMIRAGKNSQQIAQALGLKLQTVMVHRKHIRRKLGLRRGSVRLSVYLQSSLEPLF